MQRLSYSRMAMMMAAAVFAIPGALPMLNAQSPFTPPPRLARTKRRKTTLHAMNGNRECARRHRQIAARRISADNGLAT